MKKFMIWGLALATLASCGGSMSETGISGKVEGAAGETVYLQRFVDNKAVFADSAVIGQDGSFKLQPGDPMELNFYRILLDEKRSLVFLTDSTESINISTKADDFDRAHKVSGSPHSELLFSFYDHVRPLVEQENELKGLTRGTAASEEERSQALSQLVELRKEKRNYCLEFIDQHNTSPASLAALEELNVAQDLDAFKKVREGLKGVFDHTNYFKMVNEQIALAQRQEKLKEAGGTRPAKNAKYSEGMQAPDISMPDPSGKNRKLSDLKGKVVLIDFWASWCGPCRRENPNVVRTYEKYKNKGFEIFSVSLDSDAGKWQQAIQQDGLVWESHVSDLKGWQNGAAKAYGVSSIPHTILLDQDGKIIATHLRGGQLEAKLAEVLGS